MDSRFDCRSINVPVCPGVISLITNAFFDPAFVMEKDVAVPLLLDSS